jgi:hypothetical protein
MTEIVQVLADRSSPSAVAGGHRLRTGGVEDQGVALVDFPQRVGVGATVGCIRRPSDGRLLERQQQIAGLDSVSHRHF